MGKGVGGRDHPDPEISGGPGLKKKFLWPFRLQFGIKTSGHMVYPTDVSDIILQNLIYILQCSTLMLVH